MGMTSPAAQRWRSALADWAIPPHIVDAAPEPPWGFSPALFAARAEEALLERDASPSYRRAAEALPEGGSVLDVGVGGGAGSLPLAPPAALLVGVDEGTEMLASFAAAADRLGVAHREVEGSWPEVAAEVEAADVVVCHNVFYNVAHLEPFVAALTNHARHRVVVEITADHPTSHLSPLWQVLHGIERPTSPTARYAMAVLTEMGFEIGHEEFERAWRSEAAGAAERVAVMRRRLCVGPERDAEIEALLGPEVLTPTRRCVTIWWAGEA